MMDGWARNFDMSGVSFDQRMTATLVTRRHVVMAAHFVRKPGSRVIFHGRNGERLERILITSKKVFGDVAVGLLSEDVPSGYKIYPLPAPRENFSHLAGRIAAVTNQNRRIFFHEVKIANQFLMAFQYQDPVQHGWSKKLIKGDSGNPSFLISGNELVLVETHSTGNAGAGPFYGSMELQEKLQAAITELAPGYTFRTRELRPINHAVR